ncbi:MAG: DUF374 domain-containing protein [Verrucomicrobiota bacterium]
MPRGEQTTARYGNTEVPVYEPSFFRKLLLYPAFLLIKIWSLTLRLEIDQKSLDLVRSVKEPALFLFWHNHIFLAVIAKKKFARPYRMSAIASTSKDGAWPAAIFHMLGTTIVRGSAHTRSSRVAREMLAVHRSGEDLCLTPDGSRGPIYSLRPGAVFFSREARSPLLLFSATFENAWRVKSWDRFYLPKPFKRIIVRTDLVEFSELEQYTNMESARSFLEKKLLAITEDPLGVPAVED